MARPPSPCVSTLMAVLLPLASLAATPEGTKATVTFCGQILQSGERFVHCEDTRVTDIAPLVGLRDLERLDLTGSGVGDLGPLRRLSRLREVKLAGAPVADLEPLGSHPWIERLDIDKTKVDDLTPLASLRSLAELSLNDTPVHNLEPVLGLPKLSKLEFQRTPALTEANIGRLARSRTIHMTGDQVRLLALYRLLRDKPPGLHTTRHANGTIKEIGFLRQGVKDGWWASFDEQGDLVEEQDFWQGKPTRAGRAWSYNRYNCVETSPRETYFLRGCLLDHLTLTRDERLDVLKRAEKLLVEHHEDVIRQLLSAAFVDDAKVREDIGGLLVKAGALPRGSSGMLPSREQLAEYLSDLTRPLGKDFHGIQPEHCRLQPSKTSSLSISCSEFVGCEGACQERIAQLELAITRAGVRLIFHDIGHADRGLCGCCMHSW